MEEEEIWLERCGEKQKCPPSKPTAALILILCFIVFRVNFYRNITLVVKAGYSWPLAGRNSWLFLRMVWCDGLKMPRGKWLSTFGDLQMGFSFSTHGWVLLDISDCSKEEWEQRRAGRINGIFFPSLFCTKLMFYAQLMRSKKVHEGQGLGHGWWVHHAEHRFWRKSTVSSVWSHHQIIPNVIQVEGQGRHLDLRGMGQPGGVGTGDGSWCEWGSLGSSDNQQKSGSPWMGQQLPRVGAHCACCDAAPGHGQPGKIGLMQFIASSILKTVCSRCKLIQPNSMAWILLGAQLHKHNYPFQPQNLCVKPTRTILSSSEDLSHRE